MSGGKPPDEPTERLIGRTQGETSAQPPDEPTKRMFSGAQGETSAQTEQGAADSQETVWDSWTRPAPRSDTVGPPARRPDTASATQLLGSRQPPGALPPPVLAPPNPSTRSGAYPTARWFHGVTALVAWAALILQLGIVVADPDAGADAVGGYVPAIINYFSLYSVLANVVVAVVASALARNPIRQSSSFGPMRLDSVVMITMSTLIFLIVETPKFDPQGWQTLANFALFYAVPLLALVGYFLFGPRPRFSFRDILPALVLPAIWVGYTLLRGALVGWFSYSFVDQETLGYEVVAVNLVWMFLGTLLLMVGFLLLDKRLPWAPRS